MSEKRQPWMKWYPADWRQEPTLRMCSRAARSLWHDMLGLMHEAEPYGYLILSGKVLAAKQLAAILGDREKDVVNWLAELEGARVYSVDAQGCIYSRRMIRDKDKADRDRENGLEGGHPRIKRGLVPKEQRVRRFRRSDAPAKAQRIFERTNGHCHWCSIKLNPEHYHIDHVIAIRDGGMNDESNLVASCPECNGRRAMIDDPTTTLLPPDLMVGSHSDHKAQKPETRSQKPEKESDGDFELWWAAYPRHVAKGAARKAYAAALKKTDAATLLAAASRAAERYAQTEQQFIPHPATWLNGERWLDEQPSAAVPPPADDRWEPRLRAYRADLDAGKPRPFWNEFWGPNPTQPNCDAPPEKLERYGFGKQAA